MILRKEKDILEFFPIALYSLGMIAKSGGSLEQGIKFVAERNFGKVSQHFQRVLDVALQENLTAGLKTLEGISDNRFYREAVMVMEIYAKHGTSVGDRLVALGHRMETDAVMRKRNHYQRVRESLVPKTTMMLAGIGFLFVVVIAVLTRDFTMQEGGPVLDKEEVAPLITAWLAIMVFVYPILYQDYLIRNPVFVMPTLKELKQLFGNQNDGPVSRFLNNTASYIEKGWSVEMAITNALPNQVSTGVGHNDVFARRAMMSMDRGTISLETALYQIGAMVNSRKFDLTVEFIREAQRNRHSSIAETLKHLSDTFWSSHMTVRHYQTELLVPIVGSFALKFVFIMILGGVYPLFAPFLYLMIVVDSLLMLLSMA